MVKNDNANGSFLENDLVIFNNRRIRKVNHLSTIDSKDLDWIIFEVLKELLLIKKNKNKVVLEGLKGFLDQLFQDKISMFQLFEQIGIFRSDIKIVLKLEYFIIIELNNSELKQKALNNARIITSLKTGIYLNDCLTPNQRQYSKFLRDKRNSLNKQLPFSCTNGNYGEESQTGQAYYYGIRSGVIKKIFKN
jgi:hypothetical protein